MKPKVGLYFDDLIISAGHKVPSVRGKINRVCCPRFGSLYIPNKRTVKRFPVRDLSVSPSCQNLAVIFVKSHCHKQRIRENYVLPHAFSIKNN